jgi:hypothetical protein
VGGSIMGSDTTASTINLSRHLVLASQYANGNPIMNKISVVRLASRMLSQIASQSITLAARFSKANGNQGYEDTVPGVDHFSC